MNELVSIIVPVYNTKKYLIRCARSLLHQTYKNIEIILVDDGSTDESPKMCDKLASQDNRVHTIHKKNGGLSDARNFGIEIANGEFLVFVDSDDWLPLNAIETFMGAYNLTHADIISGQICRVNNINNTYLVNEDTIGKPQVYETEDALRKLLYCDNVTNSASGKLYRTRLFNDVRYPKGRLYEDLATTYKVFMNAENVAFINNTVYFYFNNTQGITRKKYSKSRLDGITSAVEELYSIRKAFPTLTKAAEFRLVVEAQLILYKMPLNSPDKKYVFQYIKKYRKDVIDDNMLPSRKKAICYSSYFGHIGIKIAYSLRHLLFKSNG